MDKTIAKLLAEVGLSEDITASLQEAFDKRVSEVEMNMREEFANRYDHDKNNLVEAMDRMITDVVTKQEEANAEKIREFTEARNAFRKALREVRKQYKRKINETLNSSRDFVKSQLVSEVTKLREEKKLLTKERLATASKLDKIKESLARQLASRINKIDKFVINKVNEELTEFNEDHRALIDTRVKLVTESRNRLRQTQQNFIESAAKTVQKTIEKMLVSEMKELREDIETNRQNTFGRKIFEAMASEYMVSFFTENTEIGKLQKMLEAKEKALSASKNKIDEIVKENQQAARKAKIAEDRAIREKTMNELLSPLRGEKRTVMEGMLDTVKTDALRETFNKLLPVVLNETKGINKSNATPSKRTLVETVHTDRPKSLVTGDNRSAARMYENNNNDIDNFEMEQVIRLAGIQK